MKTHEPIPKNHPVKPLKAGQKAQEKATCGHCGLSWDDGKITSMTPTPSGRCPFEDYHIYEEEPVVVKANVLQPGDVFKYADSRGDGLGDQTQFIVLAPGKFNVVNVANWTAATVDPETQVVKLGRVNFPENNMNPKIKNAIDAAVKRIANKKSPSDHSVAIGDQFVLPSSADTDIDLTFLVVRVHPDHPTIVLVVPMDSNPLIGMCDVPCEPYEENLTARPKFSNWVSIKSLPIANRVDYGLTTIAHICRNLIGGLARGNIPDETPERLATENDPNYEEHCIEIQRHPPSPV